MKNKQTILDITRYAVLGIPARLSELDAADAATAAEREAIRRQFPGIDKTIPNGKRSHHAATNNHAPRTKRTPAQRARIAKAIKKSWRLRKQAEKDAAAKTASAKK